jgi:hypothetical protein
MGRSDGNPKLLAEGFQHTTIHAIYHQRGFVLGLEDAASLTIAKVFLHNRHCIQIDIDLPMTRLRLWSHFL